MSDEKRQAVAMFRYGLISEFLHTKLPRGEQKVRMQALAERTYYVSWQAEPVKVTVPRQKRWLSAYRKHGLDGLIDKVRKDKGVSRAIDPLLQARIIAAKKADRNLTIPELIRSLEDIGEAPMGGLYTSTVHRLLQHHKLSGRPGIDPGQKTQRLPYRYELPHQMWLGDVMHGRVQIACRKVYLIAFIDSASRVIVHAEFAFDEGAMSVLKVFREAVNTRGIPQRLYVDHGSAFIDNRLQRTCAHLGTHHLLAPVRDGAAKAPIERFFHRFRQQFEAYLTEDDLVDLSTLNSLLWRWLHSTYHRVPHAGLDGETPWDRYLALLPRTEHRRVDVDFDWQAVWRTRATRTVRRDGTVQLKGHALEVPPTVHTKKVELRYVPEDLPEGVEVWIEEEHIGPATPVNLIANAKRRRWNPKAGVQADDAGRGLDPLGRSRQTWIPKDDKRDEENNS